MAFQDNWHFNIEINKAAEIDIDDDGMTESPGDTVTITFFYKGGVGTGRKDEFRIFVYDRSDIATDGTPESPEEGTAEKPIPNVDNITPAIPEIGSPVITPALIATAVNNVIDTNDIYAEFISGQWNAFHRGSFQVTAPASGYDEDAGLITFSGQAVIE